MKLPHEINESTRSKRVKERERENEVPFVHNMYIVYTLRI
jgi:hypothetical protein